MKLAGASTLGNVASALGVHSEENSVVAELKAGSEDAFSWLIAHYHQPVYSLVYRMVNDQADAADTVQEVFIKVFRGIKRFNGQSSLKTWIYRIAVHEASNRRRWWFRHKSKEVTIEAEASEQSETPGLGYKDTLEDGAESPLESAMHEEVRAKVEAELAQLNEPYRSTVVLRDIEDLSYEEIAEITGVSLGTVKSRLMRGRQALKKRLEQYVKQHGAELGLSAGAAKKAAAPERAREAHATEVLR
jgi:RNA polymerase sigma-70 factor, ECF subfamily